MTLIDPIEYTSTFIITKVELLFSLAAVFAANSPSNIPLSYTSALLPRSADEPDLMLDPGFGLKPSISFATGNPISLAPNGDAGSAYSGIHASFVWEGNQLVTTPFAMLLTTPFAEPSGISGTLTSGWTVARPAAANVAKWITVAGCFLLFTLTPVASYDRPSLLDSGITIGYDTAAGSTQSFANPAGGNFASVIRRMNSTQVAQTLSANLITSNVTGEVFVEGQRVTNSATVYTKIANSRDKNDIYRAYANMITGRVAGASDAFPFPIV
jgi:hypothetical protein